MPRPPYDYKWACSERAFQLAEERYEKDFYDLPDEVHNKLFAEAEHDETDNLVSRADLFRQQMKEAK